MTDRTIPQTFFRVAGVYADNILFHHYRDGWQTITYETFAEEVSSVAASLRQAGLQKGGRAAVIAENMPQWCSAYLAVLTAGGIAVPMDPQLGPAEIQNLLRDSETGVVFHSRMTGPAVREAAERLSREGQVVRLIALDSGEFRSFKKTEAAGKFPEVLPEETASIIYTSGTTGNPKGVVLTHRNFCSDAEALIEAGIVTHEDNVLAVLPLHHTYAFMCTFLVPLFLGGSITYPASMKGPDLLSAMQQRGVSILIGVPQLLSLLRNGMMKKISGLPRPLSFLLLRLHRLSGYLRERFDINAGGFVFASARRAFGGRFRFLASGGAKLDPAVMKDLEALGFTLLEGYGLTETSPVLTFNPPGRRKAGSAGRPLPSVSLRIADPSAAGEGEIEVKGPMVMQGYYKNPGATADAFRDGWFRTGDLGRLDKDGYLFITGRSKEVIVLGSGKNIYPEEVEKAYLASPLIREICILGIGAAGTTESLHAVIVPDFDYAKQAGISNIQEAVKWEINELSGRLPSYMRVTGFTVTKEPLPRTPLGKLRRFMIKGELGRPQAVRQGEAAKEELPPKDETARAVFEALLQFSRERRKIMPEDNLELDLGLDSLSKIELVASLEKAFSLKLPENFLADIHTAGELTEKIRTQISGGVSAEAAGKTGWKEILAAEPAGAVGLGASKALLLAMFVLHALLRLVFSVFFRLEARGTGNIPAGRNFILTPNHTSYLDGFAVLLSVPFARFRTIYSLGLSDYFSGPLKSWFAKVGNVIPIDSSSYLNKALQTSAYVLRHGYSLSVFPEGGRSVDGSLMEFKKGVGILAVETGVAVVPVSIKGAFDALPRTALWPRPRRITVTFGRPLRASDVDFSKRPEGRDAYQYFADVLRERVRELQES